MNGTALIINGTDYHVYMLVRVRPAHSAAEIVRVVKAELIAMGTPEVGFKLCLANRLWRLQRKRIGREGCYDVHRQSGRASQKAFVSRRVRRVPKEEQSGLQREVHLGLAA